MIFFLTITLEMFVRSKHCFLTTVFNRSVTRPICSLQPAREDNRSVCDVITTELQGKNSSPTILFMDK